jgi:putative DNA primase/helicase
MCHFPEEEKRESLISIAEIQNEANELLAGEFQRPDLPYAEVLDEILNELEPIDFRQAAGLSEKERVTRKVWIVVVVQEVLGKAKEQNVGLCRNGDFLYIFNGAYWALVDKDVLEDFLSKAAKRLGVDYINSKYHRFRSELVQQFNAVGYLPTPARSSQNVPINFINGTLEISAEGRQLREFRAEDFLTYQLSFPLDPQAVCLKWKRFLNRVLPDLSCQNLLAEYIAYIFTNLKLEKTLLLYGPGANGKSVVLEVITALLGNENITHYSLKSLTQESYRARLANKLLNYSSEISTRLETEIFKKLTSGEPVEARLLYEQPFIMTRYARLAFNCNELPKDVEHNEAYFRRFLILVFDVFIPEDERNPNLAKEIISDELSGVFNWVLEGLDRLLAQGNFSYSEAAEKALENYRKESDSVALFVEEIGFEKVSTVEQSTLLKSIYSEYKAFCIENGFRTLSSRNLRKRLEALGFESKKTNVGRLVFVGKKSEKNLF